MVDISQIHDLSGRVAALTGAASGIGKATALTLAAAGATSCAPTSTRPARRRPSKEIVAAGGNASAQAADVTRRADIDALVDRAVADHGRLDIMGNVAGVPFNKMVHEVTDDEFERILAINLKSVWYGCQAALRVMMPQGSGNIINIASGAIDTPRRRSRSTASRRLRSRC